MGAAVALRDVVGEGQDLLIIAVIPLERDLNGHPVALPAHRNRRGNKGSFGAVEIGNEGRNPAVIIKLDHLDFGMAGIGQEQPDPGIEEGQFAEPVFKFLEVELDDLEGVGGWQEGDLGALLAI